MATSQTFTKQRSTLQYSVIFFVVLGVFFDIAESAYIDPHETEEGKVTEANQNSTQDDICLTPACRKAAATILNNMNQNTEPCDDFYQFACGGHINSILTSDDVVQMDQLTSSHAKFEEQIRISYESTTAENQTRHFKLAKNLYDSCMNISRIEADGLTPLRNILKKLGGWPVLDAEEWKDNGFDFIGMSSKIIKAGYPVHTILKASVSIDTYDNISRHIFYLSNPSSGLSYVSDSYLTAYLNYTVDIAVYLGADRDFAKDQLQESLYFQTELKNLVKSSMDNRDRNHYLTTLRRLAMKHPNIAWKEYFSALLPSNTIITDDEFVVVHRHCNLYGLEKLFIERPKRVIANYMLWRVVDHSILYLNEQVRNRYYALTDSSDDQEPRWKMCVSQVVQSLPISTRALNAKIYFPREEKEAAVEMTSNIKTAFKNNIKKVSWMDNAQKKKALEKIDSIILLTAYPDELLNDTEINLYYQSLELTGGNYLESSLNVSLFRTFSSLVRLPADKDEWKIIGIAEDISASYHFDLNAMYLPASMLHGFSPDRPRYISYGESGSVFGHEITHCFYIQRLRFDNSSNREIKTIPADGAAFNEVAQCIVNQYNTYNSKIFGNNTSGESKLNENFADNFGYKQSYHAYVAWEAANKPEQALPGLAYTPRQMFWISLANKYCTDLSPDLENHYLMSDPHSPSDFRVNAPLSNFVEFSKDFNCPIGSRMNPVNKCVLW